MKNPKPSLAVLSWLLPFILTSLFLACTRSDTGPGVPKFSVSWADDRSSFRAGETATVKVIPWLDAPVDEGKVTAWARDLDPDFSLSVRGKKGNSTFITGVVPLTDGDPATWAITFIPIRVGKFSLIVTEERSGGSDSTLSFDVAAAQVYPSACIAEWKNGEDEFLVGNKAALVVLLRDAFDNDVSATADGLVSFLAFTAAAHYENGSLANVVDVNRTAGVDEGNRVGIEFVLGTAGRFLLHLLADNVILRGSPLSYTAKPGALVIGNCLGKWKYETNALQIFSRLEFFIYQYDQFLNMVSGFHSFDAIIIEKATNLSIPVPDMTFSKVEPGIQLLSYAVTDPGEFMLIVFDRDLKQNISSVPYNYKVFVGYCHALNSIVNGSGLVASVAGQMSHFSVHLNDLYGDPSPLELKMLEIQILQKNGSVRVSPTITPLTNVDDDRRSRPVHSHNNPISFVTNFSVQASSFNVSYAPKNAGTYDIWVSCGNIQLSNGHPFLMSVSPGPVDVALSRILEFIPRVKRLDKNEVHVQLVDSFSNPVSFEEEKLTFKFDGNNSSRFLASKFVGQTDGLYIGYYTSQNSGTYNICVSLESVDLSPCPLEITVFESGYFPEAHDDNVSAWEDGSVAFDVFANDYYKGQSARLINSSKPLLGSLLQYGELLRYTPYRGISGNDSFSYSLEDYNNNVATGTVWISILNLPPQFSSLPDHLVAIEDVLSPKFGGFPGFAVRYSSLQEDISVIIRAQSGSVFLAPMPLQHPQGNKLFISYNGTNEKELLIAGNVGNINYALQYIQYLGDENFYGIDMLGLYACNKNGAQDAHVPIFVEPVNDPPFVSAPRIIAFGVNDTSEGIQIFNNENDFLIGDPDFLNFPGNRSYFLMTISVEVSSGLLTSRLPYNLLNTVELKLRNSYHWQHLQTFVSISNHFVVKGKGIRIRCKIQDCNKAMHHLLYQGTEKSAVLSICVNDIGNYGSISSDLEKISWPLSVEVSIHLVRNKKPNGWIPVHLYGPLIIVEFILMIVLGIILLYFICKCADDLRWERRPPEGAFESVMKQGPPRSDCSSAVKVG